MEKYRLIWVNLDPIVGHEVKKTRPCLIISPNELNVSLKTVMVAPLTSKPRSIPTRILIKATRQSGLTTDSYVMLDQPKTIDKIRVCGDIGVISASERQAVTEILLDLFAY